LVDGDCRTHLYCGDVVPIMAGFFPDSVYGKILSPGLEEESVYSVTGSLAESGGITGFIFGPEEIRKPQCIVPTFNILPATGQLASYREEGEKSVRVQLSGCAGRPSHSHLDKGAFVVEVNGRPVFIDRGMLRYDDPRASLMKRSSLHNVITPVSAEGNYPDQSPAVEPIIPAGHGTNSSLRAEILTGSVWPRHFTELGRVVRSDDLKAIEVVDSGILIRKGRVAFHLHTTMPFKRTGRDIVIATEEFELTVRADWATEIFTREELVNHLYEPAYHLALHSDETEEFCLTTHVSLQFKQIPPPGPLQGGV
jgi:hypothetical protein